MLRWREWNKRKPDFLQYARCKFAQNDRFTPKTTSCSMQTGLAHVSQSIKAFAYCILGVQVNVQISILCSGGRVKEVQTKFLFFMEGTGCVEILAGY